MAQETFYDVLGVSKTASNTEIKKAYRKLVRKYHPDVSKEANADEMTSKINQAYQTLKDKEKRAEYDAMLDNPFAGQGGFQSGSGYHQGGYGGAEQSFSYEDFADLFRQSSSGADGPGGFRFDDLFSQYTGAEQGGRYSYHSDYGQMRGEDQHAELTIAIIDAYQGAVQNLSITMPVMDERGVLHSEQKTLKVKIPVGIREGQQIRLAGQGMPGIGGAKAGDLFIRIRFAESDGLYVDKEKDVYQSITVMPWVAALGGSTQVQTPAGKLSIKIPPGSQNGKRLRLKGKGIPAKTPGDLYLLIHIGVPEIRSEADRAVWQKLAEHYTQAH